MSNLPFVNTHTHIFTEKNIPPLIAKSFVPWPFYYLLHIGLVFRLFKAYKRVKERLKPFWKFQKWVISTIRTTPMVRFIDYIVSLFLTLNVLVFIIDWSGVAESVVWYQDLLNTLKGSFARYVLFFEIPQVHKFVLVGVLLFLYPKIAGLLWSLARKLVAQLKYVPSEETIGFIQRYLTIAEFAKYKSQKGIYDRLIKMYDPGSKVVVLPMDMTYMKAGSPTQSYIAQLDEISQIKAKKQTNHEYLLPFVFVDPRRIETERKKGPKKGTKPFFKWDTVEKTLNGKPQQWMVLKDCVLKDCLEGDSEAGQLNGYFKGIKIYPALGYYPFNEDLLPLWMYCKQRGVPITTHCIEGTIFYRGHMKKKWMHHPIFKDANGEKLKTRVKSNYGLQLNFTHPLNYLVLLEEYYLLEQLGQCGGRVQSLFGYTEGATALRQNLEGLKINLAHYGGTKEWVRYLSADRKDISAELTENPDWGIELFHKQNPLPGSPATLYSKPAWIWDNNFEWFSIISSMMLQYSGIYADISYVLHSDEMKPLLFEILETNQKLAAKILFGTDFFVVRNHKSEKELYAELLTVIGQRNMDRIGKVNPDNFLRTK